MAKSTSSQIEYTEIKYKKEDGPITIEVLSGYATMGEFVLAYRMLDNYEYKEWGKDPKRIDDDINDLFIIPFDLEKLEQYIIVILGKYAPSPRSNQIKVDYIFLQKDKEIKKITIEESTDEEYKRFTNRFKFNKQ